MHDISAKTEIEILKTFLPYLTLAGDKNIEMTDHEAMHAQRVKRITVFLGSSIGLSELELSHAKIGALLHDLGMIKGRDKHEKKGAEIFRQKVTEAGIPLDKDSVDLISHIIEKHRGGYNNSEISNNIRKGLICSIVRVADAMDIDERRSSHYDETKGPIKVSNEKQILHHESVKAIKGVRFVFYENPQIEIFTNNPEKASLQVYRLADDIQKTTFNWGVSTYNVNQESTDELPKRITKKAFVSSYCDLHGMIMGAITCNNLARKGIDFDFIYGIQSTSDLDIFWKDLIKNFTNNDDYGLFFFTDMHVPRSNPELFLESLEKLISDGKEVYYANHLERDASLIPSLMKIGTRVIFGDIWSCFYGNNLTESDIFWARIAAMCDRDSSWLEVFFTEEIDSVLKGLTFLFFKALQMNDDLLIKKMIDKIRNDDRSFFIEASKDKGIKDLYPFISDIKPIQKGYFLIVDILPDLRGRLSYYILDYLLDKGGHERYGLDLKLDHHYAVTIFERSTKKCHILFRSTWDKGTIPIRYFFEPDEDNKVLIANEHSVWVECDNIEKANYYIDETVKNINKAVDIIKNIRY